MTFKKNDFVFCDFELQQILDMEGKNVTEVSDGYFRMSSNSLNDRCFEISLKNKNISEFFKETSNKLFTIKNNALNHPDPHRYLINKWVECCNEKDMKLVNNKITEVKNWYEELSNYVNGAVDEKSIGGVKVFRS